MGHSGDCDAELSDASDIFSPIYSIKNSDDPNSLDLRAVKVAEGPRFLPACKSSFEAELLAVSELMMHVDSLAVPSPLPSYTVGHFASMDA